MKGRGKYGKKEWITWQYNEANADECEQDMNMEHKVRYKIQAVKSRFLWSEKIDGESNERVYVMFGMC